MGTIGDGLDRAVQQAFTRPVPKSADAQMCYPATANFVHELPSASRPVP